MSSEPYDLERILPSLRPSVFKKLHQEVQQQAREMIARGIQPIMKDDRRWMKMTGIPPAMQQMLVHYEFGKEAIDSKSGERVLLIPVDDA